MGGGRRHSWYCGRRYFAAFCCLQHQSQHRGFVPVRYSVIVVITFSSASPRNVNDTATAITITPAAIAYSTIVNPSSSRRKACSFSLTLLLLSLVPSRTTCIWLWSTWTHRQSIKLKRCFRRFWRHCRSYRHSGTMNKKFLVNHDNHFVSQAQSSRRLLLTSTIILRIGGQYA